MKRLVALLGVVVLGVSLALGLLVTVAGAQQPLPVNYRYQYAVKVIVGKNQGTAGVAPGVHFTSVNIHCPDTAASANYQVKLVLSGNNGGPGIISGWQPWSLKADDATQWDSTGFATFLTLPPFFEGFFVIESDVQLDVVAVYTGQVNGGICGGALATMEIERVPYRYMGGG